MQCICSGAGEPVFPRCIAIQGASTPEGCSRVATLEVQRIEVFVSEPEDAFPGEASSLDNSQGDRVLQSIDHLHVEW